MKYVNSLKYMNGFATAEKPTDISLRRAAELCNLLGRVHIGNKIIYLPAGSIGYATAVMLESVIKQAGYRVGRITSSFGADSRSAVYIGCERASIDDYNRAVAEIKAAVSGSPEQSFCKEEAIFAMSLLICKMNSCDYVILQGMSDEKSGLASLCAPYDLVIAPTVCGQDGSVKPLCDAIRRDAREVISGNQRKSVYDLITAACFSCGARLTFTSKSSFDTEALSSIERVFSYGGRSGYRVKSPSDAIAECAMLAIESALAIRRSGVKLPWTSISAGLASAMGMGCFEIMSASPLILLDSSENEGELELLLSTLDNVFDEKELTGMAICIPAQVEKLAARLEKYQPSSLIAVGEKTPGENCECRLFPKNARDAARLIVQNMKRGIDTVCFGSVAFTCEIKGEISRLMN